MRRLSVTGSPDKIGRYESYVLRLRLGYRRAEVNVADLAEDNTHQVVDEGGASHKTSPGDRCK